MGQVGISRSGRPQFKKKSRMGIVGPFQMKCFNKITVGPCRWASPPQAGPLHKTIKGIFVTHAFTNNSKPFACVHHRAPCTRWQDQAFTNNSKHSKPFACMHHRAPCTRSARPSRASLSASPAGGTARRRRASRPHPCSHSSPPHRAASAARRKAAYRHAVSARYRIPSELQQSTTQSSLGST